MKRVAIVIPCRGEGDISGLIEAASKHGDVFIADDNAIDGRTLLPYQYAGAIRVAVPATRHGFSEAYRLGILAAYEAGYQVIIEMDAGGSHDPASIPQLLNRIDFGYDLVSGRRFDGGRYIGNWKRKLLSWVGTRLFNLRYGTNWADATGGFIAYRRESIPHTHGYPFEAGMHWYQSEVRVRARDSHLMQCEVPIVYRSSGSSLNWKGIWEACRLIFR